MTTNAGGARQYKLYKLTGYPEFVYKFHFMNQCKKKEEYQRKMRGVVIKRHKAHKKYCFSEDELN